MLQTSHLAGQRNDHRCGRAIPLSSEEAAFQSSLTALPLITYQVGETVIANGSRTGRLLILRKGTVAILKEDMEIAKVAEPGAVFGELSLLLDQPHNAEVRALETSQFHMAGADAFLKQNPIAILYVARLLASRLDAANHALAQLKIQLRTGKAHHVVAKTVSKIERLLSASGASLVYAGYPYDPFA